MSVLNKKVITGLVGKRLKGLINSFHIFSVVNIFIDEFRKELLTGKEIKITNFGTFYLTNIKERRVMDIKTGEIIVAKPTKALRFRLSDSFKKQLEKGDQ